MVNGQVITEFNTKIDPECDVLTVDGKRLEIHSFVYLLMYKPQGVVTTVRDEKGRRSVIDLLPEKLRHVRPVGRLDMYSEGLLILTNDGDLTQKLTHPVHHVPKTYLVQVAGRFDKKIPQQLTAGVSLDDGPARALSARTVYRSKYLDAGAGDRIIEIVIAEGRNRQVRRMMKEVGLRVIRLVRVRIGALQLGQMTAGHWRYLGAGEIRQLELSEPYKKNVSSKRRSEAKGGKRG